MMGCISREGEKVTDLEDVDEDRELSVGVSDESVFISGNLQFFVCSPTLPMVSSSTR